MANRKKDTKVKPIDPTAPERVELPPVHIKRVTIPVRGITPLVVNQWSEKAKQAMRDAQQKKARSKKEAKDPQACFEGAKYIDPKTGEDCVRARFFKAAMVAAGRFVDGVNMTQLRMSIFVEGDVLPLEFDECIMDESMVRNANGVADIRYRPMYTNWATEFTIQYHANDLTLSQVILLVREAGQRVGICEGRPEKSATLDWGRFDIDMKRVAGKHFESRSIEVSSVKAA